MRRFLLIVAILGFSTLWFRDFVADGRFIAWLDKTPDRRGTATAVFFLARYYDIFNDYEKSLSHYERIVERYPRSRYGEEARFGLAFSLERMRRYREAIEAYETYLEKFPDGRYVVSVRNNIDILRTR